MATKIHLTKAALENVLATGIDPQLDVEALVAGTASAEDLLSLCLDGADENAVDGWREYVRAVVVASWGAS